MANLNDALLQALSNLAEEQRLMREQHQHSFHSLRNDMNENFGKLNGRVRKTEQEIVRIKSLWLGVSSVIGVGWHFVSDYVKAKFLA
ncbi:MAG TPA: hypothetical protein VEI97_08630 [bacterium]|nr:hypothetical protein [bacterium]